MLSSSNVDGCGPIRVQSWYDLQMLCPRDPRGLIAYAELAGQPGDFTFSDNFASNDWIASPLSVNAAPTVSALETDNQQKVADAKQWSFSHLTWNGSSNLASPLRKLVFLRGGLQWENHIQFDFGDNPISEIQISFLINAASRGDKAGTIPVIRWTEGSWSNHVTLSVVLQSMGMFNLGIMAYDGTNYSMNELALAVMS